jgi:hypothetical protein
VAVAVAVSPPVAVAVAVSPSVAVAVAVAVGMSAARAAARPSSPPDITPAVFFFFGFLGFLAIFSYKKQIFFRQILVFLGG